MTEESVVVQFSKTGLNVIKSSIPNLALVNLGLEFFIAESVDKGFVDIKVSSVIKTGYHTLADGSGPKLLFLRKISSESLKVTFAVWPSEYLTETPDVPSSIECEIKSSIRNLSKISQLSDVLINVIV